MPSMKDTYIPPPLHVLQAHDLSIQNAGPETDQPVKYNTHIPDPRHRVSGVHMLVGITELVENDIQGYCSGYCCSEEEGDCGVRHALIFSPLFRLSKKKFFFFGSLVFPF